MPLDFTVRPHRYPLIHRKITEFGTNPDNLACRNLTSLLPIKSAPYHSLHQSIKQQFGVRIGSFFSTKTSEPIPFALIDAELSTLPFSGLVFSPFSSDKGYKSAASSNLQCLRLLLQADALYNKLNQTARTSTSVKSLAIFASQ